MNDFEEITSRENNRLKYTRKVRDGKVDEAIFVEGRRLCEEALQSGLPIEFCLVTRKFVDGQQGTFLMSYLAKTSESTFIVDENLMRSATDTDNSQGIILVCKKPETGRRQIEVNTKRAADLRLVVYLHEINIPANLGAILRTAEAAGISGIIISAGSADPFSPKAIRGSMGSALRLPLWNNVNFNEAVQWANQIGLTTTGTASAEGTVYTAIDWKKPRLLIFGSEGHGLSGEQLDLVADAIKIPLENGVESLNLGVACGILLFEARRQVISHS